MKDTVLDRLSRRFVGAYGWGLPDWDGNFADFGIFTPGQWGVVRPVPWDAFASASAPGLPGDDVHFAVADDRTTIVRERVCGSAVSPLVDALCEEIDSPFCAVAVRDEGDVWAAAASRAEVVELADVRGDELELTRMADVLTTRVDGEDSEFHYPAVEALLDHEDGDTTIVAHRFKDSTWIAEVFPL